MFTNTLASHTPSLSLSLDTHTHTPQTLCRFRMEVNVLRAPNGLDGIAVDDALRYLRASHFILERAMEIYKNYQVRHYNVVRVL